MAAEVRNFAVSVAAGTPQATPQVSPMTVAARIVRGVRVRVPPGPAGLVGWALSVAGTRIIPWGANEWMVQDNEVTEWQLDGQITSGAWQLQAYNTGVYAHTVYVTFLLDLVTQRPAAGVLFAPLEIAP